MKIVVIGGTGLIGSKVVAKLQQEGHTAIAASPNTGVDTLTGEGVAPALAGADVVVDVSNSPSFADDDVMAFFQTATANLLREEEAAGVGHHVVLSIVGNAGIPESGYMRAKTAQEELIVASGRPYSFVRATQFFEFTAAIADSGMVDGVVRIPPVLFQPIAASEVADAVARVAAAAPLQGALEVAGPDRGRFDEIIRERLAAAGDPREVVADPDAPYFGAHMTEGMLVPAGEAQLGTVRFSDWLVDNSAIRARA